MHRVSAQGPVTPYHTSVLHNPKIGQIGDCWRACIGSIIDAPPANIPNFMEHDGAISFTQAWLKERGWAFEGIALTASTPNQALQVSAALRPGKYLIFSGSTWKGTGHSVVVKDGQIIHNPTEGAQIVSPCEDGRYWANVIYKIRSNVDGASH